MHDADADVDPRQQILVSPQGCVRAAPGVRYRCQDVTDRDEPIDAGHLGVASAEHPTSRCSRPIVT